MAATGAADSAQLRTDFAQLVDGELLAGAQSHDAIDVINPATGMVFARAPRTTRAELDRAVGAARRAFPGWRARSYEQRRAHIGRLAAALRAHQDALAELLTREQGKPLSQARDEIARAAIQSEGLAAISIESELLLDDAQRRIVAGGQVPAGPGYFVPPTLIADLPDDARLVREEQFGPLLPLLRFNDIEDAIRRANDTRFGLAASVWSGDPERARAIALRLEVGTAWINQHRATAANVPFGGVKDSGLGRNYSVLGLQANMEVRVISLLKN